MHSPFWYVAIAALGLSLGYFLTRAPELRHWRVAEMTAIPGLLLGIWRMSPANGLPTAAGGGAIYVLIAVLAFVLAPVISHHLSVGFENFLFRANWTRAGEEIHLRPIRRLIDEDQFHEALRELNELLEKHPATYEAALLKAKLLYHIGGVEETAAALTQLIGQCQTVEQQLGAMDALACGIPFAACDATADAGHAEAEPWARTGSLSFDRGGSLRLQGHSARRLRSAGNASARTTLGKVGAGRLGQCADLLGSGAHPGPSNALPGKIVCDRRLPPAGQQVAVAGRAVRRPAAA